MPKLVASFPRQHRLKNEECFRKLRRSELVINCGYWRLYILSNSLPYPRLGLAIAKRYVKSSPRRNLLRRLAREYFRHRCGFKDGYDYLLTIVRTPESYDRNLLRDVLSSLLGQTERCVD